MHNLRYIADLFTWGRAFVIYHSGWYWILAFWLSILAYRRLGLDYIEVSSIILTGLTLNFARLNIFKEDFKEDF